MYVIIEVAALLRKLILRCCLAQGQNKGRVTFQLEDKTTPKTAENFRALCTGEKVCRSYASFVGLLTPFTLGFRLLRIQVCYSKVVGHIAASTDALWVCKASTVSSHSQQRVAYTQLHPADAALSGSCSRVVTSPTTTALAERASPTHGVGLCASLNSSHYRHLRRKVRGRELQAQAHRALPFVDGQRRQEHKRLPVLHHHRALPMARACVPLLFELFLTSRVQDGKHVVFGKVIEGQQIIKDVEAVGSGTGKTKQKVEITASGADETPIKY